MSNPSSLLPNFGKRVRALRLKKGISQEELAELAMLDRTYISGIERGTRNVGLKNLAVIADALDVSMSQLLEGLKLFDE